MYRYNGKLNSEETGYVDFNERMYDPDGGRFMSIDGLTKSYPMLTPYQYASNNPVWMLDIDGLEGVTFSDVWHNRASVVDRVNNPDTWMSGVHWINSNINPLYIANAHAYEIRTGKDFYTGEEKGRSRAVADLGVDVVGMLTMGKLFKAATAANALEAQVTQQAKVMSTPEATSTQAAAVKATTKVNGELVKGGATVGFDASKNYRATFFAAHPELEGKVVVHHAIEQQVLTRYPNLFTEGEINSLQNLRGIPNAVNSDLHLSQIRRVWNQFYRTNSNPTREQVLNKATEIDKMFGKQFLPSK